MLVIVGLSEPSAGRKHTRPGGGSCFRVLKRSFWFYDVSVGPKLDVIRI